jgi:hypothetical protein
MDAVFEVLCRQLLEALLVGELAFNSAVCGDLLAFRCGFRGGFECE